MTDTRPQDVTGEEGERVTTELKGVKLFIKRGGKEFTNGMYGHIKVLSYKPDPSGKETDEDAGEVQSGSKADTKSRTRLRKSPTSQAHDATR